MAPRRSYCWVWTQIKDRSTLLRIEENGRRFACPVSIKRGGTFCMSYKHKEGVTKDAAPRNTLLA